MPARNGKDTAKTSKYALTFVWTSQPETRKYPAKRYIVSSLNNLELSPPIRYERYYINDSLRVQKKDKDYQKEILDDNNDIIEKADISEKEFLSLKEQARSKIIRDSYLYLKDDNLFFYYTFCK